ncbi:hypothetical protein [Phormidium sp. CCY1219]|uniref:hypothetical protein n=1 Tax=Phormidium sp. CCY1219 TaxID=2886104 RepID=UPI002D1EC82F|nr:hypothetical protein [Phormidium sp. CCY1219]MEB3831850.1 hypothetical protein [Phormidium sp. CCY1219]
MTSPNRNNPDIFYHKTENSGDRLLLLAFLLPGTPPGNPLIEDNFYPRLAALSKSAAIALCTANTCFRLMVHYAAPSWVGWATCCPPYR